MVVIGTGKILPPVTNQQGWFAKGRLVWGTLFGYEVFFPIVVFVNFVGRIARDERLQGCAVVIVSGGIQNDGSRTVQGFYVPTGNVVHVKGRARGGESGTPKVADFEFVAGNAVLLEVGRTIIGKGFHAPQEMISPNVFEGFLLLLSIFVIEPVIDFIRYPRGRIE